MTAHRVRYEGPSLLAVQAATLLANADGIELTSAGTPEPRDDVAGGARLTLTVEGSPEAVQAAVRYLQSNLPAEAHIMVVEEQPGDE